MMPTKASSVQQNNSTGSSNSGEPEFIIVGKIGRPHGVKGEMTFQPMTDYPQRLVAGKVLLLGKARKKYKIVSIREKGQDYILTLEGIESREDAQLITNQLAYVPLASLPPLPEGEFYHHELLGMRVIDTAGSELGILAEILETGANDVYVVVSESGEELLLPVIPSVILEIDSKARCMTVQPQDWA